MHHVMHSTCIKHGRHIRTQCIGSCSKKELKFYQTRSNAIILHETLPACCIPKVVRMGTGAVTYEKVFLSLRTPPKISLKHDWKRELGSEDAQRPGGQVVQQLKVPNRTNQIQTQIMIERGHPLSGVTQGSRQVGEKRPVPRRSKHVLFMKKLLNMIERGNPL